MSSIINSSEALIMIGTINPGSTPFVAIKNPKERLFQYLCSLVSWIKFTSLSTVVFCENSNTSYDFKRIISLAEDHGKTLEVLVFDGNDGSQKYGKGFGDGLLMEYAIQNSKLLRQSQAFYKITGRLFVENFDSIKERHAQFDNVFMLPENLPKEDKVWWHPKNIRNKYKMYLFSLKTRGFRDPNYINNYVLNYFYKSNVEFFKKNLIHSYRKVNDNLSYWLEHAYYDNLTRKDFQIMLEKPKMVGRSGSMGTLLSNLDYDDAIKNIAADLIT